MDRFRTFAVPVWLLIQGAVVAFIGLLLGALGYGWSRWKSAGDFRMLGALARLATGAVLGLVFGLIYARDLPPDMAQEVLWFLVSLGTVVGGLWGLVWLAIAPEPPKE